MITSTGNWNKYAGIGPLINAKPTVNVSIICVTIFIRINGLGFQLKPNKKI